MTFVSAMVFTSARARRTVLPSLLAACVAVSGVAAADGDAVAAAAPRCTSSQLRVATAVETGGARLTLANASSHACTIESFATLAFRGRGGARTPVTAMTRTPFDGPVVDGRRIPMGHGPVVRPLVLQPHGGAATQLQWIAGPAVPHSVCADTATVTVTVGDAVVDGPLYAHVCGRDDAHVIVTLERLAPTP